MKLFSPPSCQSGHGIQRKWPMISWIEINQPIVISIMSLMDRPIDCSIHWSVDWFCWLLPDHHRSNVIAVVTRIFLSSCRNQHNDCSIGLSIIHLFSEITHLYKQSIDQSTNQLVNHSVNQTTNQSIDEINHSQCANLPVNHDFDRSICRLV